MRQEREAGYDSRVLSSLPRRLTGPMDDPDPPEEVWQIRNPEEKVLYATKESKALGVSITPATR